MNYEAFINEISNQYGYDEELKKAISISIPLMVRRYGKSYEDEILNLFRDVRIFSTNDMKEENRKRIGDMMVGGINSHVIEKNKEENLYGTSRDPGSYYSYETVYDSNMQVTGEVRWLVVEDKKGSIQEEGYRNLFGTSINMPYFLHEMNHAFAMQKPVYRVENDTIYSKHGMYEQCITFHMEEGKAIMEEADNRNVIIEEMVNEMVTQDMLTDLLGKEEYSEVAKMLGEIGHVRTSYNGTLISIAQKLEKVIGREELLRWRIYNDDSVLTDFEECVSQSDIALKYTNGEPAYSILDKKSFALFTLGCNCYKMSLEEYTSKAKLLMMEAFTPLFAYQEVKKKDMSLAGYEELRRSFLGEELIQKCQAGTKTVS